MGSLGSKLRRYREWSLSGIDREEFSIDIFSEILYDFTHKIRKIKERL